MHLEKQ